MPSSKPDTGRCGVSCSTMFFVAFSLIMCAVAVGVALYYNKTGALPIIQQVPVIYALSEFQPPGRCVPVDLESIQRGYVEQTYSSQKNGTLIKLSDESSSMVYHLKTNPKLGGAICASMLQVRPLCHCIIDLAHQDSQEHLYTEMFNMVITANSTSTMLSSMETLPFCGDSVEVLRYSKVFFRYITHDGMVMDHYVDGLPSLLVQQMRDVMANTFKCPPLSRGPVQMPRK